jgi:hypothetical protein
MNRRPGTISPFKNGINPVGSAPLKWTRAPFRELADAIARRRIVPFVGAGLSQPMDMPLWGQAMRKLHDRIHNPNDSAIAALIDAGRFL